MVFGLYKRECADLEWKVKDWGFHCAALHGNKSQDQRTAVFRMFRANTVRILVRSFY